MRDFLFKYNSKSLVRQHHKAGDVNIFERKSVKLKILALLKYKKTKDEFIYLLKNHTFYTIFWIRLDKMVSDDSRQ